jgi:hypothetical protein
MTAHKMTILYFIINSLYILNDLNENDTAKAIAFIVENTIIENQSKHKLI